MSYDNGMSIFRNLLSLTPLHSYTVCDSELFVGLRNKCWNKSVEWDTGIDWVRTAV